MTQRVLIFFPTYNEAKNVAPLFEAIREHLPNADVLVVDDASPDGTGELLDRIAQQDPSLSVVHRPGKLGLGSAHKLAMLHARDHGYDVLITMDADFSHHPRYLPTFLELLEEADFVIGSRYAKGGHCDYGLGRQFISRTANLFAKAALGLKLEENTTMYRGFRASLLRKMKIEQIKSEGYSFAVESLYQVSQLTDRLAEFPIHFENRAAGASKISQKEIYKAVVTIERLGMRRLSSVLRKSAPSPAADPTEDVVCRSCQGTYHVELYPARDDAHGSVHDASPYSCASHSSRSHGQILRCLRCGLIFMKPRLTPSELVQEYADATDPVYLEHIQARETTFRYNLARVRSYLKPEDKVLEVGSYCGAFLKIARDEGLDIIGVEPSRWAAEASAKITDARVICGTIDDVSTDLGPFDAIVAWDVLEHFANPVAELKKMSSRLKEGGTLLFSTLMIDNWFPQATGKHWPWLMDMHLYYFTESTIRNVLEQTGFEIIDSDKYCHIVTLEYLLAKLGTLGVPLGRELSNALAGFDWVRTEIPFRFGDIKFFVCRKNDAPKSERSWERATSPPPAGEESAGEAVRV